MHLYFEERNVVPKEEKSKILIAHGFHKEVTIQDFPLRGNTGSNVKLGEKLYL
ncbi:hypothetical protein [Bizionia saleffrena]|uniref:hypothetical protein n=1 Tax=Bizionia saleffrena TaxID=291189 RepID=UPI001479432D|nr:hypothetical protein [Bizionia saleffrena]